MTDDTPVLELRDISKSFGSVQALTDVDLEVHRGEVMALVGDNGAGKSTLIKCDRRASTPPTPARSSSKGSACTISGPKDAARLGIEVVYQDLALCDNLDVVQNMFLGREAHNSLQVLQEPVMEQRTATTLKSLAVTTIRSIRQPVATLSGGQRQSVAVARAVMWNSKLVILDEPTAALGVAQTEQVLALVKRLGEQGLAVILISHNLHDIFAVADRITVLRLGRNAGLYDRLDDDAAGGRPGDHGRCADEGLGHPDGGTVVSTTEAEAPAFDTAIPVESLGTRVWENIKGGNLGSLPVAVGLTVIVILFAFTAQNFFTAVNFNNIIVQMAGTTMLAFGVVFVLLLGEIDLSIAFLSGIVGVACAKFQESGSGHFLPGILPIVAALAVGVLIGAFQGSFVALIGVPSFVVTLAGLLAWQGFVQREIGAAGPIIIQNHWINDTASYFFTTNTGWLIWAAAQPRLRRQHRLRLSRETTPRREHPATRISVAAKLVAIPAVAALVVAICNHDRGVPLAGIIILFFLLALDVRRQADDVRPSRVRRRRQRRGCPSRRHQRAADQDHRVHDLRADGRRRRHHPRRQPSLGRAGSGRRHAAARLDLRRGDRRHEPVRRPRRGARGGARLGGDRDDRERAVHPRLPAGNHLHHHRLHPALRRHARHDRAPPPGEDRPLVTHRVNG